MGPDNGYHNSKHDPHGTPMNLSEKIHRLAGAAPILLEWLGPSGISVSQEIAQSRTDICRQCDFNKPGSVVTEAIAAAIKGQKELMSQLGLKTDGMESLNTCQICTCPLKTKIWIPRERLLRAEDEASLTLYWKKCWMRNEKP